MSYIVQIDNGGSPYWLAPWSGDPGRTVVRNNAQRFSTLALAQAALSLAVRRFGNYRPSLKKGIVLLAPTTPVAAAPLAAMDV